MAIWLLFEIISGITTAIWGGTGADSNAVSESFGEPVNRPEPLYPQDVSKQSEAPDLQIDCGNERQANIGTLKLGIIATCGSSEQFSIASVTKSITALVLLDSMQSPEELNQIITVDQLAMADLQASKEGEGTLMEVFLGEQFSKRQGIEGMLYVSANNLADTLVRNQFGSLPNYKAAARKYLDDHDLADVRLGNDASGLDNGTKATPAELFVIGKLVMESPILKEFVGRGSSEFPTVASGGAELTGISNANPLLEVGFNGVKLGYTGEAGRCILFTKPFGDDIIIGSTLGDMIDADGFTYADAQRITRQLEAALRAPQG